MKTGIIGLPNVGKSTLFNALSQKAIAEAANYPFCTIKPNSSIVDVQDSRLEDLAKIAGSQEIIFAKTEFVDIAGLVRGASQGEGLGNQFLGHIRDVNVVLHMLRCFDDQNVLHVCDKVDPIADAEIVEIELMLADIQSLEQRCANLKRKPSKESATQLAIMEEALSHLHAGKMPGPDFAQHKFLQLLTTKPVIYVCNVDEAGLNQDNSYVKKVREIASSKNIPVFKICAELEAEIAGLSPEDREPFLAEYGLTESGLNVLTKASYQMLNLISFFTVGKKEARAWPIKVGVTADKAAGEIHGDLERGFIKADIITYRDYLENNGEVKCRELGKIRSEGRDYIMQDGDVMHVKFNV